MPSLTRLIRRMLFAAMLWLLLGSKPPLLYAQSNGSPNDPPPVPDAALNVLQGEKAALEAQLRTPSAAAAPANDDIGRATIVAAFPYSDALNTQDATVAGDDPILSCGNSTHSNTVWYKLQIPGEGVGTLKASTDGSNYDTVLAIFSGARGSLVLEGCNDDFGGSLRSQVTLRTTPGRTYYVEVADYGSAGGGNLALALTYTPIVKINVPLDIVLLQDETGSMRDDISQLQSLAPEIWDNLAAVTTVEFRIGVVGFRDYARSGWGEGADWVYRSTMDLTASRTAFQTGVDALTAQGGADVPEAQYPALLYLASPGAPCIDSNGDGDCTDANDTPAGQQPTFRSGARRVILLATDASFHTPDTDGYPGPTRDAVLAQLLARNILVIGLTPGGPGSVAQVDDLTAATGGATFSTGAQGQDIADAIAQAVQQVQVVSPENSTVTASATSAPANSAAPVTITVTLRDGRGAPVANHVVGLSSDRTGSDLVVQPISPTDSDGIASGSIRSLTPGLSKVRAVDITSGVSLQQEAVITFGEPLVPPGEELASAVRFLVNMASSRLAGIGETAEAAGANGDYFYSQIGPDTARLGLTIGLGLLDGASIVEDMARPIVLNRLSAVLIEGGFGWQRISVLVVEEVDAGKLFNLGWRHALETRNWALARELVKQGWSYLALRLAEDGAREIQEKGLEWVLTRELINSTGMTRAGSAIRTDLAALQNLLVRQQDQLLAGVPALSDDEEAAYAQDMYQRAKLAIILDDAIWTQNFLLENVRLAHEGNGNEFTQGIVLFVLKFAGKCISSLLMDGVGTLLYSSASTAIEARIDYKNLDMASRSFAATPAVLKRAGESGADIYQNTAIGMDAILARLPVRPPQGEFTQVGHYDVGYDWIVWWQTREVYSEIELHNTGDQRGVYELLTKYSIKDTLFGFPYALLTFVDYQTVELEPGERKTVRVSYKDEQFGGAPTDDTNVTFTLLGKNEFGSYVLDTDTIVWQPLRVPAVNTALGAAAPEARSQAELAALTAVETPIDVYIADGEEIGDYAATIWVSNPFTATITAYVTQTLPAGSIMLGAANWGEVMDPNADPQVWQVEVPAHDVRSRQVFFHLDAPLGASLVLTPATLSFVEPGSQQLLVTDSNDTQFRPTPPVALAISPLQPQMFGAAAAINGQVTNAASSQQSGVARLRLFTPEGALVYNMEQGFTLAPEESSALAWDMPTDLRPGDYRLGVELEIGEGREEMYVGVYEVTGSLLFLPNVVRQ